MESTVCLHTNYGNHRLVAPNEWNPSSVCVKFTEFIVWLRQTNGIRRLFATNLRNSPFACAQFTEFTVCLRQIHGIRCSSSRAQPGPRAGSLLHAVRLVALDHLPRGESCRAVGTKILDVKRFDSSRILILRGGILMCAGDSPETLSQQISAGTILAGRLGARRVPVTDHRPWIGPKTIIFT